MTTRPTEQFQRRDVLARGMRFVLVNERSPRVDASCAVCCTGIDREIYICPGVAPVMHVVVNQPRMPLGRDAFAYRVEKGLVGYHILEIAEIVALRDANEIAARMQCAP